MRRSSAGKSPIVCRVLTRHATLRGRLTGSVWSFLSETKTPTAFLLLIQNASLPFAFTYSPWTMTHPPVRVPGVPLHWKCIDADWSSDGEWIAFIRTDSEVHQDK